MAPVLLLLFLAPFVGEWLLGNQRLSDIHFLPFMALLYGCGAVLIRETTRRAGRGYATMLGLGVAYALWEEGLVDQLLFNANYFTGQAELSTTVLPLLGIDLWLTLLLVAMHAAWSTFVPIVLVETIFSGRGRRVWLGKVGLGIVMLVFLAGSVFLGYFVYSEKGFLAPWPQLLAMLAILAAVTVASLRLSRLPLPALPAPVPRSPWMVGVVTFVFSSLYMTTADLPGSARLASSLVLAVLVLLLLASWSRDQGWKQVHSLAAVTGALATYAWLGLVMEPEAGPRSTIDLVGSFAFIAVMAWLVWLARRNLKKTNRQPVQAAAGG